MPTITTRQFRYAGQRNGALFFLSVASALALSACGGNGDVSLPETPAAAAAAAKKAVGTIEGAWIGTITVNEPAATAPLANVSAIPVNPTTYAVSSLVLGDGSLWSFYGTLPGQNRGYVLQGFHHAASGSLAGLTYSTSKLNWYSNYFRAYVGSMDARVTLPGTMNATGTPIPTQQLQAFNITAVPFDSSVYDYNKATTLADIATRTWSGNLVGGVGSTAVGTGFSIKTNGDVTGNSYGCNYTGRATPHGTKNYFVVTMTAANDPTNCSLFSGATLTGIAIKVRVKVTGSPEWDQLLAALTTSDGSTGGVFYSYDK